MKKLTKVVILLLLTAIFAVLLCSCHGARPLDEFEMPEEFDYNKKYEITFLAKCDSHALQTQIFLDAIEEFEKLYPNIKVNLMTETDYKLIDQYILKNLSNQQVPNICVAYPDHVANYMDGHNIVVSLDELISDERYGLGGSDVKYDSVEISEMVTKFLDEGKIGGEQYLMPLMRSSEVCYVNLDLVHALGFDIPEAGLTWDFIFSVCEKAMEPVSFDEKGNPIYINGQSIMVPFMYKSTDNMMIQMLKQLEAPYSNELGEIQIFNDATAEILYTVAEHARSEAFNTFKLTGYPANFLNAGQCIFAIDSTAGATWMGSDAPLVDIAEEKLVQFETKVMTIPQFDPLNPVMISQGPSMCVFNKEDPQEVLASWLFAQYMLTNEVQIAYSQTEGYAPVTTKAQNSAEYQDYLSRSGEDNDLYYDVKLDATKLLLDNTGNTFVTPVFNGSASLRNAAGQLIENVNKSVRRKQEINEDYMADLYEEVSALYRLDQISTSGQKVTFGPLPQASKVLIWTLAICWIAIATYTFLNWNKKNKL